MTSVAPVTIEIPADKPRDTEIDVFGRPVRAWKPFESYGHDGLLSDAGVASIRLRKRSNRVPS